MDSGILVVRLIVGLAMAAHGAQKLFGWFGGYGVKGTGEFMESIGFRPGTYFAVAAGLGEAAGGLLLAAGLLGPIGPALIVLVMTVAAAAVHWPHGFFAMNDGIELPLLYATAASAVLFAGNGAYSVDALLGIAPVSNPVANWAILGIAILGGLVQLAVRRPAPSHAEV